MTQAQTNHSGISRRRFMGLAGLGLIVGSSCRREPDSIQPDGRVDLGSGDVAALNFAFAIEQIETAFFKQVCSSFYAGIRASEQAALLEIRGHDQAHEALFRALLGAQAIRTLSMDFSKIDFNSRDSVLNAAKEIKDLMLSAYNGLGVYCSDATHLGIISKINSVEARHASVLRELLLPLSFADISIIDPISGVDTARSPQDALMLIHPYIQERLNADKLQLA